MTVRLTQTATGRPPRSYGIQIDDDGHATGWQTAGHRVGTFARELSGSERARLERALTAARNAGAPAAPAGGPIPPSSATDQLVADGLPDLVLSSGAQAPPGYDELYQLLLELRESIAESPLAAIELDVSGSPLSARLRHVGSGPVTTRMATLTVQATLFDRDSSIVDSATHTIDASGATGQVGPGWNLSLADDLGVKPPRKGGFLTVTVGTPEVDALGDGVLRGTEFSWMAE
jgi:hypothetical protein